MEKNSAYDRYQRQLILPGFGKEAQEKLLRSRVLVIGAGGLGCPVLMNLTGMGAGTIGIVDDGKVELSNLHRQLLYDMNDVGELKTDVAKRKVQRMNPDLKINIYPIQLTNHNALNILSEYDLVVDCTDNFPTRYMLSDACRMLKKTIVFGAVSRYDGQVAVFNENITYRNLFPDPPQEGEVPDCNEAGVLGVLPNIIGSLMAGECIKLITGIGESLKGKLLTYSVLNNDSFVIDINSDDLNGNQIPHTKESFEEMNYPALCGVDPKASIGVNRFIELLQQKEILVIDVREQHEIPVLGIPHQRISLANLADTIPDESKNIVFVCQSGKRSIQAVRIYEQLAPSLTGRIFSLENGINSLPKEYLTLQEQQ